MTPRPLTHSPGVRRPLFRVVLGIGCLLLASGWARAEKIPALAVLPEPLPAELKDAFSQRREALHADVAAFLGRAKAFNAKKADQQSDDEYAGLERERADLVARVKAFNARVAGLAGCADLERRLEQDKRALETQRRSIGEGMDELDAWARQSEEAQENAIRDATKSMFGFLGEHLASRIKSARAFEGWLTRYQSQLEKEGVPFAVLEPKIRQALSGYTNAMIQVPVGHAIKEGVKAADTWELVKKEIGAVAEALKGSDASVEEVINDPDLKKAISAEGNAAGEFVSAVTEMAADSKQAAPAFEHVLGATTLPMLLFLRDYGYDATQWEQSRERIVQQYDLKEKELQAVNALKGEIERTVHALEDCRAEHQPVS